MFTTSPRTRRMSFFVSPARLAVGLEAKNLLLLIRFAPCFGDSKLWFPRVVGQNNFGN
jgi:hypothetical protein